MRPKIIKLLSFSLFIHNILYFFFFFPCFASAWENERWRPRLIPCMSMGLLPLIRLDVIHRVKTDLPTQGIAKCDAKPTDRRPSRPLNPSFVLSSLYLPPSYCTRFHATHGLKSSVLLHRQTCPFPTYLCICRLAYILSFLSKFTGEILKFY